MKKINNLVIILVVLFVVSGCGLANNNLPVSSTKNNLANSNMPRKIISTSTNNENSKEVSTSTNNENSKEVSTSTNKNNSQDNSTSTKKLKAVIDIKNFAFSPATLNIAKGTTVTWINLDSATHKIKSDSFNSNFLAQRGKFSFTFKTAGTFNYICSIHPNMKGQIIVE